MKCATRDARSRLSIEGKHGVVPIPFKAHKVRLMSAELIEDNYQNHYGGAIRRLNNLEKKIANFGRSENSATDFLGLNVEILETASSVSLHEIYFSSIGDESEEIREFDSASKLGRMLSADFGSVDKWMADFSKMCESLNGGANWLVLAWSDSIERLFNIPVDAQVCLPYGLDPILVLNLNRYAYEADFGENVAKYTQSFMQSIHWRRVSDRFDKVLQSGEIESVQETIKLVTVCDLKAMTAQANDGPLILDVRHRDDCNRFRHRITGTQWRSSYDVSGWFEELPKDKPVVVYCMYGFWVSQDVATELRAKGYDAYSLAGGIVSWRAMGYETTEI